MNDNIMVSIICNTYNHVDYVREALESFVSQKTNFLFEVLIHDDASTDGTVDIIKEYVNKYPDIIKPIYQKENKYSKGIKITRTYQFPRVKGKYIAICEGDDYWTDVHKLQKQVDAMEKHPNIDICAHAAVRRSAETNEIIDLIAPSMNNKILSIEDVILGGGGYVVTNSIMYRTTLNDNIPEFRQFVSLDYTLQIHGAIKGGMLFLTDCMSVYRWLSKGSWTVRQRADFSKRKQLFERFRIMYEMLNEETNYKFVDTVRYREMLDAIPLCQEDKEIKKEFWSRYSTVILKLGILEKCKVIIKVYFPVILKLKIALWNRRSNGVKK